VIVSKRGEVDRFLGSPPPGIRVVLLYGRDRGGVHERADLVAKARGYVADDPFGAAVLTDADLDGDGARLADELSALSLMGGARSVRLRLSTEKASVDKAVAEAVRAHAAGDYNPDCFLTIEAGALGKDSALRKAAEQAAGAAAIPCYEDEAGDVARLVREALRAERVGLTPDALDLFVARLPHERGVARQEIERLVLYLSPGSGVTATVDDLTDHLGVEPEASLADAAVDAFGARLREAHTGLQRAFGEGETGVDAIRALSGHLGRLRKTAVLTASGASAAEAAKAARVFWKQEREFLRQARFWTAEALDGVQPELLDADRACKQAGSPDALLAERLYLTVAARAKRLGL